MDKISPKNYLWQNVCALMGEERPSIDAVARRTKCSRGTIQRLRDGQTSVGVDIVAQIAGAFGLAAWQLLIPDLDPVAVPTLSKGLVRWPFRSVSAEELSRLSPDQSRDVERGLLVALAAAGVSLKGGRKSGTDG